MNKPAPPPIPKSSPKAASSRRTVPETFKLDIAKGKVTGRDRIVVYGTGGVGKTTAAACLPKPLFVDVEGGTSKLNVSRLTCTDWMALRSTLASIAKEKPEGYRTIVLDTITRAQSMAEDFVVETFRNSRGEYVDSIERFSFGKGWQFLADEMVKLFSDLDRVAEAGYNVCVIAHDISSVVPNPAGEDFLRWEPSLYSGNKQGRGDVRSYAKGWADHVLFFGYDVAVQDGKGVGHGSRTIYTSEHATHVAKSRSFEVEDSISFTLDAPSAIWESLSIS